MNGQPASSGRDTGGSTTSGGSESMARTRRPGPAGRSAGDVLLAAESLAVSFGPTPALVDASVAVWPGEVLAMLGPVRVGQVDAAALPGRDPAPGLRVGGLSGATSGPGQRGGPVADPPRRVRVRVPVRAAGAGTDRGGERRPAAAAVRGAGARGARRGRRSGWSGWTSPTWRDAGPGSCPAGSSSGWRWPGRWSAGPRVVFADEPTGSLDSFNGEVVMDLLTATARQLGAAVVLVTHDNRVAAYSDREIEVRDGRTVAVSS